MKDNEQQIANGTHDLMSAILERQRIRKEASERTPEAAQAMFDIDYLLAWLRQPQIPDNLVAETLWAALKAECCKVPEEAKVIVLSEEKFLKAVVPLFQQPASERCGNVISREAAMSAMCYMCAKPERYGPPKPLEGSARLFHFQGSDNRNAGQCFAQPILSIPVATTGAGTERDSEQYDDEDLTINKIRAWADSFRAFHCTPENAEVFERDRERAYRMVRYLLEPPATVAEGAQKDDGWVTFGRVKVDIENETETFERIHPPQPSTATPGEGAREYHEALQWAITFFRHINSAGCSRQDCVRGREVAEILSKHCTANAGEMQRLRADLFAAKNIAKTLFVQAEKVRTARADAVKECVEVLKDRIAYHESKDVHNGRTGNQSGPCCEKCEMKDEHFTGRADALKALVGCRNPFQLPEVCQCHIPVRQAVKNGVAAISAEFVAALESLTKKEGDDGPTEES